MTTLMNGIMDILHDQSLPTIGLLQESFPNSTNFMISISTLLDPRYVFLIYAPILFALNKRVGHRMIIALTWAEWANQILKWLLAGERPYWYVHERANEIAQAANFSSSNLLGSNLGVVSEPAAAFSLKQFPVTCELGAGSPSGHAMVTATVWYILIDAYLKNEIRPFARVDYSQAQQQQQQQQHQDKNESSNLVANIFWSMYTVMLLMVSLSRVYLACHFPHQCLCGALLGCLMARFVAERLPMDRLEKSHFCYSTIWMFGSAMATYGILRATGFDPLWSVSKAMRWCVKSEYIHLDTTPFFSMMRYLGFCLGAGLAYDGAKLASSIATSTTTSTTKANKEAANDNTTWLTARRLVAIVLAVAFGQFLMALPMPKSNLNFFYVISFFMYTTFSYAIAGPIPDLVKSIMTQSRNNEQAYRLKQR